MVIRRPDWLSEIKRDGSNNSIVARLFQVVFCVYLIVLTILTSLQIVDAYHRSEESFKRELTILSKSFEGVLGKALLENNKVSLRTSLEDMKEITGVTGIAVLNTYTEEVVVSGNSLFSTADDFLMADVNVEELTSGWGTPISQGSLILREFDIYYTRGLVRNIVGRAAVFASRSTIFDRIKTDVYMIIGSEILKAAAIWLVLFLAIRLMLKWPLNILTSAATRLAQDDLKDFKVGLRSGSSNELVLLARAFEDSAEKLSDAKDTLENRMRLALKAGKIATWVWYPRDDVLKFDEHMATILGHSPDHFGNSVASFLSVIHPDDRAGFRSELNASVAERTSLDTTFRVLSEGQETLFIEVQGVLHQRADLRSEPYLVGTVIDVTERHKANAELRMAKGFAEDANRAKSRFLASMSHDLRTPLNAILGFSEVLHQEFLGPIGNVKYLEYSKDIHSSGTYLLELVDELLDLAAIEAGQTELQLESLYIAEIVHDCTRILYNKIESKSLLLNFEPISNEPRVKVDRRAFKQVLLNVLSNAVKFSDRRGKIWIRTYYEREWARIEIEDNGPGIPQGSLADITAPFSRGKEADQQPEKGWGLGLAISRSLVECHKGHFVIESIEGEGTTVKISIPLDTEPSETFHTADTRLRA